MSLKERLMQDLKSSMKNKEKIRKNTIIIVRASIKQREVDERRELGDEEIIGIISKQVKQRKDSIKDFEKGSRQDLIEAAQNEMNILMDYLPQQLSETEIDEIVKGVIDEVGANSMKDIGKVMGKVMPKVKGRTDGNMVNQIVKQYLK